MVAPVRGEHFADRARLSDLIAPPYDVISDGERQRLAARDPHNIVHLILPEGNGDRYETAARTLSQWREARVLVRDAELAALVLVQEFSTPDGRAHVRSGLLAGVAVEPYAGGRVRPHERTHAGPKADRLALMRATGTMFESLFFLARDASGALSRGLSGATQGPAWAEAELDGVRSRLWRVTGPAAAGLTAAAGDVLYIADGHHRFETAVAYQALNPAARHTAGLIVPLTDPGLVVLATHRLIQGAAIPPDAAKRTFETAFAVEEVEPELNPLGLLADRRTTCLVLFPGGRTLRLSLKPGAERGTGGAGRAGQLDVSRVDALAVTPLQRLAGGTVAYSAFPREAIAQVGSGAVAAAVLLAPTRVEDVLAVADAREFMPQKSTYFVPKVPSGLLLLPAG